MKKGWKLISLTSLKNILVSAFGGLALGIEGVLLHNSYSPFGLLLALVTNVVGLRAIGRHTQSKKWQYFAFFIWILVVYRAGSLGVSQELLIAGDRNGLIFLTGGLVINFLTINRRTRL